MARWRRRQTKRKVIEAMMKIFAVVGVLDDIGLVVDESVLPWSMAENF